MPLSAARGSIRASHKLLVSGVLALILACGPDGSQTQPGLEVVVDTVGDTITVRTLAGREWESAELVSEASIGRLAGAAHEMFGNVFGLAVHPSGDIFVYDGSVPALRRYASDGTYLNTIGREGGGPGEYENSDGGLAVLRDGRIVLRDSGNGRFNVYTSDGEYAETWLGAGGVLTSFPLVASRDGGFFHHTYNPGVRTPRVVHYSADGGPVDTFPIPLQEISTSMMMARTPAGTVIGWNVPFMPEAIWSINDAGESLTAVTDQYEIDRHRADGMVVRMGRVLDPVPVSALEREAERERTTRSMRSAAPGWQWDGPPIPTRKPFFRQLFSGTDGRLWVALHQPSVIVREDLATDGDSELPRFEEAVVFDVFEPDGRYLGQVSAPDGFSLFPSPTFGPEAVWAVGRGELGVQQVVRYRLVIHN